MFQVSIPPAHSHRPCFSVRPFPVPALKGNPKQTDHGPGPVRPSLAVNEDRMACGVFYDPEESLNGLFGDGVSRTAGQMHVLYSQVLHQGFLVIFLPQVDDSPDPLLLQKNKLKKLGFSEDEINNIAEIIMKWINEKLFY